MNLEETVIELVEDGKQLLDKLKMYSLDMTDEKLDCEIGALSLEHMKRSSEMFTMYYSTNQYSISQSVLDNINVYSGVMAEVTEISNSILSDIKSCKSKEALH